VLDNATLAMDESLRDIGDDLSDVEDASRLNRFQRAFDAAEVQELEDRIKAGLRPAAAAEL
jgi:hypothetical protein